MRKLSPAYVVTSVVIALAGTASSRAATVPGGTNRLSGSAGVASPQASATPSSAPVNSTPAPTSPILTNTSSGADGSRSGSNTNSSAANAPVGSSSSSANGNAAANGNTSVNGTRSGSNIDSSAANTAPGSTSATGTSGSSSVNGSTSGSENSSGGSESTGTVGTVFAPGVTGYANRALIPGMIGGVTSDGERVIDNSTAAQYSEPGTQLQYNGKAQTAVSAQETASSSRSFDSAVNEVKRERRKIGRNGQLLQSIAPRTNVDRTNEMPDDGPSPALTVSSSALVR